METYKTTHTSGQNQIQYGISPTECSEYIKKSHNKRLRRELSENNKELRYFNRESDTKLKILFLVVSMVVLMCLIGYYFSYR